MVEKDNYYEVRFLGRAAKKLETFQYFMLCHWPDDENMRKLRDDLRTVEEAFIIMQQKLIDDRAND